MTSSPPIGRVSVSPPAADPGGPLPLPSLRAVWTGLTAPRALLLICLLHTLAVFAGHSLVGALFPSDAPALSASSSGAPADALVFAGPELSPVAALPRPSAPSPSQLSSARALLLHLAAPGTACVLALCRGWSPSLPSLELRALRLHNDSAPTQRAAWVVSFAPAPFSPALLPDDVVRIDPAWHTLHPEAAGSPGCGLLSSALYALLALAATLLPTAVAYGAISSLTAPLNGALRFMASLEHACLPSAPPPTPTQRDSKNLSVPGSSPSASGDKPPGSPEVTVRESKRVLKRLSALVAQHQQAGGGILGTGALPSPDLPPRALPMGPTAARAPSDTRVSGLRKRSVVASALAPRDLPSSPPPRGALPLPVPSAGAALRGLSSAVLAWLERARGSEWQLQEMASLEAACGRLLHAVHASQRHSFLAHDAKRQFSRYLFHELRVPFNTVVMGIQQLQLAAESADPTPVADMAELLDLLDSQCGAIINILNDTMSLQKLEEGAFSIRAAPFSLHNLVLHTVQAFYPAIEERNLRLTLRLQSLEDLHAADPRELVIDNSFHYDPSSPMVSAGPPLSTPALLRRGSSGSGVPGPGPLRVPSDGSPLAVSPSAPVAAAQNPSPRPGLPCAAPTPLFLRRTLSEARVVRSTSAEKLARRQQLTETIRVIGDQNRIRQVIANLISNAIKYTPQNGSISVSLTAEPADDSPVVSRASSTSSAHSHSSSPQTQLEGPRGPRTRVRLSVKDTGPGIPSDRLATLFKPFSQFRAGEAQQAKGTGLGLAISRRLVELHGGRMGCHSEIGRGAEFFFSIDMETVAGAPDEQPTVIDTATALKGPLVSSDFRRTRLLSQSPVIRDAKALLDQTKRPAAARRPAQRVPSSLHTARAPSSDLSPRSPLSLAGPTHPAAEAATGARVLGLTARGQTWTAAPSSSSFTFAGAGSFASDTPAPSLRALPPPTAIARSQPLPEPAAPSEYTPPRDPPASGGKEVASPTDPTPRDGIRLRRPLTAGSGHASAAFQTLSLLERALPEDRIPFDQPRALGPVGSAERAPLHRVYSAPEPVPSPRPESTGHSRSQSLCAESELKEPSDWVPPLPLGSVAAAAADPSPSLSASSLSASASAGLSPASTVSSLSSPAAPSRVSPSVSAAAAAAVGGSGPVAPPARSRPTVLVADDSAPTRKLVGMILQRLNFDVLTVENGAEAVETFRAWIDHRATCPLMAAPPAPAPSEGPRGRCPQCPRLPCDLVLMDGCMPVLGGLEATQQLRQAALPLPILGLTGNALPEDQAAFLAAGADAVLLKPVDRAVLAAALNKHLSRPV